MKVKWLAIAVMTVLIAHSQIGWADEPIPAEPAEITPAEPTEPAEQVIEEGGNLTLGIPSEPTGGQQPTTQPPAQMSNNPPPSFQQPPAPPQETPPTPPGADSQQVAPG